MTDLSPNGNNGTANGGISIGTATNHLGVANKATSFDGVDDSVIVPSTSFVPLSTTAYSISLWIWDDTPIGSLSTYHRIISWANGSNSTNLQFGLGLGNGLAVRMFYLTYGSANAVAMTSGDIPNGWNHGVVTYDGSVYRMYVNGDLRSQNAYTRNDIGLYAVSALYIGQRGNGAGVIGSIADTRIYNRALSQAEITQLYNSN